MLKKRLFLIFFFVLGVSLVNTVVLIEASNQHNELSVDAANQVMLEATYNNTVTGTMCKRELVRSHCNITDANWNCVWTNLRRCKNVYRNKNK